MIILKKDWIAPSLLPLNSRLEPMKHQEGMELRIGEMVIMLDYPESKDWYVAEISQVLHDRFTVVGILACSTCGYSGIVICLEYARPQYVSA